MIHAQSPNFTTAAHPLGSKHFSHIRGNIGERNPKHANTNNSQSLLIDGSILRNTRVNDETQLNDFSVNEPFYEPIHNYKNCVNVCEPVKSEGDGVQK